MFNKNCLVADLKRKCKEFKISYQGTKSELIKRLNKYISENGQAGEQSQVEDRDQIREDQEFSQVEINAPEFEFESDGEEVESINSNGKRTRSKISYNFTSEFENLESAKKSIKESEFKWLKLRNFKTKDGLKEFYKCSVKNCKSKLYILYHDDDQSVSIWTSDIRHEHVSNETEGDRVYRINQVTKEQIAILYKTRVKTATNILYALREKESKYKAKKFDEEPDELNEMYVPGIKIPTRRQINNFLHNTFKPSIELNEGKKKDKI